jgi:tight adherence protein C
VLAIAAALAAFVATCAGVLGVLNAGSNPADARFSRMAKRRQAPLDTPFLERVGQPALTGIGGFVGGFFPRRMGERQSHSLLASGWKMTTAQFRLLMLSSLVAGLAVPMMASLLIAGRVTLVAAMFAMVLGAVGMMLPLLAMRRAIRARKAGVLRSLPDACDLLTLSVEAGLGLDGALRLVSQKLGGPLAAEVAQALREVGLGRPRRDALEAMAERADVPELAAFVAALVQADQLGTALGAMLRSQSITLRTQRRQRAQEMVRKAPVKMVFPLVFFTMPAFFIVTVGPVAVRLINYLSE